ncbi:MAG: hypothetical protein K1000chlam3_00859 [Chlamydiae bacterium]|nr:hypothetical protein [Chlamydiota bacterium]
MCVNSTALLFSIPELRREVLQYLPLNDLSNCERVCKVWKIYSRDNFLWAGIATRIGCPFNSEDNTTLENGALRSKVKAFILDLKYKFILIAYDDEVCQNIIDDSNPPLENQIIYLKNYYDKYFDPTLAVYISQTIEETQARTKEKREEAKESVLAFY